MRYKLILTLFIFILLQPAWLGAEDLTRYRVEILVLTHIGHDESPSRRDTIRDYALALDFLTPPPEAPEEPEEESVTESGGEEVVEAAAGDEIQPEEAITEEEPDPNAVVHVEEMSDVMREAWRRLRLSAPFRPEQYLSWEQGSEAPFPSLRIHDLEAVLVDDPFADLRSEAETIEYTDATDLEESAPETVPALPEPTIFYRLDGTATLRRSRFLHLDLDIQLREPLWDGSAAVPQPGDPVGTEPDAPSAFAVHELRQSRQVKTGRVEYFDGPVMGVLAFVVTVDPDAAAPLEAGADSD